MEAQGDEVDSEQKELVGRMERVRWRLLRSSRKRSREAEGEGALDARLKRCIKALRAELGLHHI
jgi:hypothetical protein